MTGKPQILLAYNRLVQESGVCLSLLQKWADQTFRSTVGTLFPLNASMDFWKYAPRLGLPEKFCFLRIFVTVLFNLKVFTGPHSKNRALEVTCAVARYFLNIVL